MSGCASRLSIAAAILLAASSAASAQDVTALVAAGNKSSVEMIDAYYAEVTLVKKWESNVLGVAGVVPDDTRTATYWRTRNKVRISEQFFLKPLGAGPGQDQEGTKKIVDVEIVGGQARVTPTFADGKHTHQPNQSGAIVADKDRRFTEIDPWELSLFYLPHGLFSTPPATHYTLSEAIQKGQVTAADWSKVGDRRLAHLTIKLTEARPRAYELWVDPAHNWLVTKCLYEYQSDSDPANAWKLVYEVEQWAEPRPSLFVPTRVTQQTWRHGKLLNNAVATFEKVLVNSPTPPVPKMPALPAGTLVNDETRCEAYQIDGNGMKTGPVYRVRGSYEPPTPAPDPMAPFTLPLWIWSVVWVLLGAALLLGVAVGLVWWSKRARQAMAGPPLRTPARTGAAPGH